MNKANYLISRTLKGAMAFVLAVGLCPVAPAMAQEGATANEEGGAAAAVVDGADVSTDGAAAGATGDVAGSEADGVQSGGVSGDGDVAADGAGVGAPAQDAVENDDAGSDVSTDVAEAAAAADGEADGSNDAAAQTDGWQAWGGCEWMIDSEGCLTIRPKDGAEVGKLPNCYRDYYGSKSPWCAIGYSVKSVKVEKLVKASQSLEGIFEGLSCASIMDLSGLDTSNVADMSSMFSGCSSLASLDLSGWDTSNVADMSDMFSCCSNLASLDVSGWDTSKVTGMSDMFSYCSSLASLDLSGWDTSNVADMDSMFYDCASLASLDLSGWDTSKVTYMRYMFDGCSSLREVSLGPATRVGLPAPTGDDVSGRWVSSADGVAYRLSDVPAGVAATYTAQLAESETSGLNSLGSCVWTIGEGGELAISPLPGCASGELCDLENSRAPFSRHGAEVASVRIAPGVKASGSLSGLFSGLSSAATMDLSGLDASNATDMSSMFSGCSSLSSLDLSSWDTSKVSDAGTVFASCSSLRKISLGEATRIPMPTPLGDDVTGRWVSPVDGIAYRPADLPLGTAATYTAQCSDSVVGVRNSAGGCMWKIDDNGVLLVAPLPGNESGELDCQGYPYEWSVSAPWASFNPDIYSMIYSVRIEPGVTVKGSASGLFAGLSVAESMDLSGLDTSGVTDMSRMFSGCTLLQAVDLSSFDTSSVTNMSSIFEDCESLRTLDLSGFDASKVKNMSQMFQGCSSLASLDLSSLDTSSVAGSDGAHYSDGMYGIFSGCSSLTNLDLSSFNTSKVYSMSEMFRNCKRLKSVNLSSFDTKRVACFGSMFSGCDALESLDLSSFDTSRATKMEYMFNDDALSRVTLGDKFSFSKNGKRLCSLPSSGGNADWYDESTGKAYSVDEIPDNVATTYVKQKRLERDQFTVDDSWSAYTGAPIKKPIKSDLVEGVDYVVSYENNVGPGSALLNIRGINRWYGELSYHFYIDGSAQRGQWMHDSNGWWYVDASGSYPSNEWRAIDGSYYYFNGSGYMCTNWMDYGGAWYWLGGSGAMATGWQSIGGSWYFFDDSGAMASGWKRIDGSYYYFSGSGAMQTGWLSTGGAWYYLSGSGAMATGWQTIGGARYHFDGSGAMASGWSVIDGSYYYFDGSGSMQTGWLNRGGAWYWLGDSGVMATSWQAIGGAKYWFDDSGAMATGWKWIGGSCYYFDGSGAMQADKWIGGSYVDSDGRWDQSA